ncbi:MAG: hypothetical protein HC837_01725 [Chloroflexaceae bacterium]|nr:hypothetical protein [Chloroflexaceae bacterium]
METVVCPVCKQKLGVQAYIGVDSRVVCANPKCNTTLRITSRKPLKAEVVPVAQLINDPDSSPESYG